MNYRLVTIDEISENPERFIGKLFKFFNHGKICYLLDISTLIGSNNEKYYRIKILTKTKIDSFFLSSSKEFYFLED